MREMIFKNTKVSGHHIKDIEMQGVFSFFETDAQSAERILSGFNNVEVNGREVRITKAEGQPLGSERSAERSEKRAPRERTYTSARSGSSSGSDRKYGGSSSSRSGSGSSSSRGGSSSSAPKPRFKKKNDDTSW